MHQILHVTYKWARRVAIAVVGGTVLLIGAVMVVTPGPALLVIPVGLAILGIEFAWARHWLRKVREAGDRAFDHWRGRIYPRANRMSAGRQADNPASRGPGEDR